MPQRVQEEGWNQQSGKILGTSGVLSQYLRSAPTTWNLRERPVLSHLEQDDTISIPRAMVITGKYHSGIEMYECCLRTNTYFQVTKELSFFRYYSIISNSQKGLGFQEHSHDCLPSNRGYILFCCDSNKHFRNFIFPLASPPVLCLLGMEV